MTIVKDTRITITTPDTYRMELFTKRPQDILDPKYPVFKMGRFRARREDNAQGERYFLSDLREGDELVNAILLHDPQDLRIMRKFGIKPNYVNDRVEIYRFGNYDNIHPTHSLIISRSGILVIDKSL